MINQKTLKEKHTKLIVEKDNKRFDAIYFNFADGLPEYIDAVFTLEANEYKGLQTLQLQIKTLYQA